MGKVPSYNSLKACKGTMFFLPLPHNKTIETLNDVTEALPSRFAIARVVSSLSTVKPTKTNVVWRSLVDVKRC